MAENGYDVPVQVVFQGGGARLCTLMAVCDVLREFESANRIKVTALAGSSAGAIAAVMLASRRPMIEYCNVLREIGPRYLSKMDTSVPVGMFRVAMGRPFFKDLRLTDFFEELFCRGTKLRDIKDLQPVTPYICYTDLYSLSARYLPADEAVPMALAKSCNFPYAFVGFKSNQTEVDGGLALNLPVDKLIDEESQSVKGNIIAIGFQREFHREGGRQLHPLVSFTQSLFSAAIQHGVLRSEALIGAGNFFAATSKIGTFDFEEALKTGLDHEYRVTKYEFSAWLNNWVTPFEARRPSSLSRYIAPVQTPSKLPEPIVSQVNSFLRNEAPCIRARSVQLADIALLSERGDFTGDYRTKMILHFDVLKPLHVLQVSVELGEKAFREAKFLCSASHGMTTLKFTAQVHEVIREGGNLRKFLLFYLFDEPLLPDKEEPYLLEYEYEGDDPYPGLGSKPDSSVLTTWLGDADEMTLLAAFPAKKFRKSPDVRDVASIDPQRFGDYNVPSNVDRVVASEELQGVALINALWSFRIELPLQNYKVVARRATGVSRGSTFGFVIE